MVVREGTEGLYCGAGGAIRRGTEHEVATEVSINTAYGVERVVRYAFELAMKRRKHVTLVHKKNVLVNAGDMWQNIVNKVAAEYPEVQHDYSHIDAATIYLVTDPSRFDVILTDNLFGDILTDEAGAVVGGVGYSASGCINASNEYPSCSSRSTVLPPTSQARAREPDRRDPLRRHAAASSRIRRRRRENRRRRGTRHRRKRQPATLHRRSGPRHLGSPVDHGNVKPIDSAIGSAA